MSHTTSPSPGTRHSFAAPDLAARSRPPGESRFDIYRTEQVHLTSTLFGGGDWHWRLTGQSGKVLADCGGYRDRGDCLAAVDGLRAEAQAALLGDEASAGI